MRSLQVSQVFSTIHNKIIFKVVTQLYITLNPSLNIAISFLHQTLILSLYLLRDFQCFASPEKFEKSELL